MTDPLAPLGDSLRRADRDRYATAMFADPQGRRDLWVLYAFNLELSQIRTQIRDPMAGMIRLQWWREVVEGGRRGEAARHPVAGPLLDLLDRRQLPLTDVLRVIDCRERDLDAAPFADRAAWMAYGRDGAGALAALACRALGSESPAAEELGMVWALTGLLRSVPFHLAQNWLALPQDALVQAGLDPQAVLAARADKAVLVSVVAALAAELSRSLGDARRGGYDRRAVPALLPAVQARAYLARIRALGGDVFDARSYRPQPMPLRLGWAALRGRV